MARVINVDSVGAKMFIHSYNAGDGMIKITNHLSSCTYEIIGDCNEGIKINNN